MIPIRNLLKRIQWDEAFSKADFRIGYYDRIQDAILVVPLERIFQETDNHFLVQLIDNKGIAHMVPFHRIKAVYRNGEMIWKREH